MVVLRSRFAYQRTGYGQIGFDRQAKSELNKSTQTMADDGVSTEIFPQIAVHRVGDAQRSAIAPTFKPLTVQAESEKSAPSRPAR